MLTMADWFNLDLLLQSHHRPREGPFELNDVFAMINSVPAIALIFYGFSNQGLVPGLCLGLVSISPFQRRRFLFWLSNILVVAKSYWPTLLCFINYEKLAFWKDCPIQFFTTSLCLTRSPLHTLYYFFNVLEFWDLKNRV